MVASEVIFTYISLIPIKVVPRFCSWSILGRFTPYLNDFVVRLLSLLASLFFYIRSKETEKVDYEGVDATPVKDYITSCLEGAAEKEIWEIGIDGDYSGESVVVANKNIPFYDEVPAVASIENELAPNILAEFDNCFNTETVTAFGFNITAKGSKDVSVSVFNKSVVVHLLFPLEIGKERASARLSEFSATVPVGLGELYAHAARLVSKAREGSYDLTNDCRLYGEQVNVYVEDKGNYKIIKFVDYSTFYGKKGNSFIFQLALKKDIRGGCTG